MSLHAYHPETGASVMLTDEQLSHMRVSGWVLRSEWDEQEALKAEQAKAAGEAATIPAAKTAKSEGK